MSKKLVTLDDKVALEVPLAELAVQEPDYKRLLAFLKAMEFFTLTRRVAEFSGIDAGEVEPDAKLKAGSGPGELFGSRPGGGANFPSSRETTPPDKNKAAAEADQDRSDAAGVGRRTHPGSAQCQVRRSRYEIVRSPDRLAAWITRAFEVGQVAIDTEASSLDPMQATLCGFALAVGANESCYVPLAHRRGGDGAGLFAGPVVPDQIDERAALTALKPLLEHAGVLKIGHNLKFGLQLFALRGIELAPHDDTMLISYVLDAGRASHDLAPLAQRYFDHAMIDLNALTGSGKSRIAFECVDIDRAAPYAAERADLVLRLWRLLKSRFRPSR